MPVYEYRCRRCANTYDVFHRHREIPEDVICPVCGAPEHTKLISAPGLAIKTPSEPSWSGGTCTARGGCGMD
jgi:putative FmdB family regulatory protein